MIVCVLVIDMRIQLALITDMIKMCPWYGDGGSMFSFDWHKDSIHSTFLVVELIIHFVNYDVICSGVKDNNATAFCLPLVSLAS